MITIAEFLQIVANLYKINTQDNQQIRDVVQQIFSDEESFCSFFQPRAQMYIIKETQQAFNNLLIITNIFKQDTHM